MEEKKTEKWPIIYPIYLDKAVSLSKGRKVPAAHAVANPKAEEIGMVCKFLNLEYVVESEKRHPADFFNCGRVRVKIVNDDKSPVNAEVPNKKALLVKLGEHIPNLKSRVNPTVEKSKTAQKNAGKKNSNTTTKPTTKPKQKHNNKKKK